MGRDFDKPEIGILWINKYYDNKPSVISGHINGERVLILSNRLKNKQSEKAPDFTVFSCDNEATHEDQVSDGEYNDQTEVDSEEFEF